MSGVNVKVNKAQLDAAKEKLRTARLALKDGSVPMRQVAVLLDQWVQRNFQTQGDKVGGWNPFKYGGRLTTKAKATGKVDGRYVNSTAKLLRNTGAMQHSFLPFIRNASAGIGSELPYSKYHEEGEGWMHRRLLPENKDVDADVKSIFDAFIKRTLA